jgi:secondary thiamine-phosphate synthase enzyme
MLHGGTVFGMWAQRAIRFESRGRGFHLITPEVLAAVPEIARIRIGILHLFLRHTSAALTLGENFSPDVRRDFAAYFDRAVPEDAPYWTHTLEGADDMPAHIKSALLGAAVSLPIAGQGLALGTWQGIYLCEFRDAGGPRSLVATVWGEAAR